jgi:hypothetical protein
MVWQSGNPEVNLISRQLSGLVTKIAETCGLAVFAGSA